MDNYYHKLVLFSKLKHISLPIPEIKNYYELFFFINTKDITFF